MIDRALARQASVTRRRRQDLFRVRALWGGWMVPRFFCAHEWVVATSGSRTCRKCSAYETAPTPWVRW